MPKTLVKDEHGATDTYARFVAEPFEAGYGHTVGNSLRRVLLSSLAGARWEFAPFSAERKAQEPGDFYSDISKIRRLLGWSPRTPLREGLEKTIAFYRLHRAHYW